VRKGKKGPRQSMAYEMHTLICVPLPIVNDSSMTTTHECVIPRRGVPSSSISHRSSHPYVAATTGRDAEREELCLHAICGSPPPPYHASRTFEPRTARVASSKLAAIAGRNSAALCVSLRPLPPIPIPRSIHTSSSFS
jgi:hypothetical protein